MTQDNAYAFASFAAIGGFGPHGSEGENFYTMRLFGDYKTALEYARGLVNADGYDYAYVAGVHADGSLEQRDVTRVADDEPSVVDIEL